MDSSTCPMVQWDMQPFKEGQWTPMGSPTCPMVQWDMTDSGIQVS